jgi:adenylyl-sulfate kinase
MNREQVEALLAQEDQKELLRLSTAGSVDDGKSTLIGRLLYETANIYEDHLSALKRDTKQAHTTVDWSLLTDGLKAEREQGITIDVAYRYFATERRKYIIADTPGHEQYTRNMATGASTANVAIILIDARKGMTDQSRRHAFIASLLAIPHVVVAVNKMDLVDFSEDVFKNISDGFADFAARLNITGLRFVPISALEGDNVVARSANTPWYQGRPLLDILDNIHIASDGNMVDLRFPIQYVLRPDQSFRGFAGRVASGILRKGSEIMVLPSRKKSQVAEIVSMDGELDEATPGQSVTVTLEDEIDISRGDMIAAPHNHPRVGRHFEAMLVWMDESSLKVGDVYWLKHATRWVKAEVVELRYRVDVKTLHRQQEANALKLNEIGRAVLVTHQPLNYDAYRTNRQTGSFILVDAQTNATAAAGMIIERQPEGELPVGEDRQHRREPRFKGTVSSEERLQRFGQTPRTIWLTGLVSVGKRETAYALERILFDKGVAVNVLEGGAARTGISSDLGFGNLEVQENVRRAAETARAFNDAGLVSIAAFVSPDSEHRNVVSDIVGASRYIEVFLDAPLEWCRDKDQTGLYKQAESGEILYLAGVQRPYEAPQNPDFHIDMTQNSPYEAAMRIYEGLVARRLLTF